MSLDTDKPGRSMGSTSMSREFHGNARMIGDFEHADEALSEHINFLHVILFLDPDLDTVATGTSGDDGAADKVVILWSGARLDLFAD